MTDGAGVGGLGSGVGSGGVSGQKPEPEQEPGAGAGTVEVRIAVSGTHTRRDDLEALHIWLRSAPDLEEVRKADQLAVGRKVSEQQTEGMSGELIQDIVLVVSVEVARNVIDKVWRSVETWVRNRRRFADPEETPRVTLDAPGTGPGAGLGRDTDEGGGTDEGGDTDEGGGAGPDAEGGDSERPRGGGGGPVRRGDEAGEV